MQKALTTSHDYLIPFLQNFEMSNSNRNSQQIAKRRHDSDCGTNGTEPNLQANPPKRSRKNQCFVCREQLTDQWPIVLQPGNYFCHPECLRCTMCHDLQIECGQNRNPSLLDGLSCFVINGYVYCLEHYRAILNVLSGKSEHLEFPIATNWKCFACGWEILLTEMVNRIYSDGDSFIHTRCFNCQICNRPITDTYHMDHGYISCGCDLTTITSQDDQHRANHNIAGFDSSQTYQQQHHIPQPQGLFGPRIAVKPKRDRTSFKPDQLHTLKHYFNSNPNPDSKEIDRLCAITRLTKRVVQVWFQNRRAKAKKDDRRT